MITIGITGRSSSKSLGIELILVRSDELLAEMAKVTDADAERLADLWISEATEIKKVKRSDIIRPARLYYAFKQLLKKYDAAAITYDSATLTLRPAEGESLDAAGHLGIE